MCAVAVRGGSSCGNRFFDGDGDQVSRKCGDCSVCCTYTNIPVLQKPFGQKCQHECGGCSIYENRPAACASFECSWLGVDFPLPEWARPDLVGAMPETIFATVNEVQYSVVLWYVHDESKWLLWRDKLLAIVGTTNQMYRLIPLAGIKAREAVFIVIPKDSDRNKVAVVADTDSAFYEIFANWCRYGVELHFGDGAKERIFPKSVLQRE